MYHLNWYTDDALFIVECKVIHHDLEINVANIYDNKDVYMFH